jgi:predicted GNAT family N-acyltransferase
MNGPSAHRAPAGIVVRLGDWATLGEHAGRIRVAVFVEEQRIPIELEWDGADASSLHVVAYDGEQPVGTGRLLPDAHIGRMAVLPAYRRDGLGGAILETLVAEAAVRGHAAVELSAQVYVRAFYERHGFVAFGPEYDDAGIPHQSMRRMLG